MTYRNAFRLTLLPIAILLNVCVSTRDTANTLVTKNESQQVLEHPEVMDENYEKLTAVDRAEPFYPQSATTKQYELL